MTGKILLTAVATLLLSAGAAASAPVPDARADPSPIPKAAPGVARSADAGFRTDTFSLPLSRAGEVGSEVDYLVRMKAGDTLVYSWTVEGAPSADAFYSDFHGATALAPPLREVSYREGIGVEDKGAMTAPFAGVHGWLFKNDSGKPVTVKLTIAGFYELRSMRETMGLGGADYQPFGPPGWAYRYGPLDAAAN